MEENTEADTEADTEAAVEDPDPDVVAPAVVVNARCTENVQFSQPAS